MKWIGLIALFSILLIGCGTSVHGGTEKIYMNELYADKYDAVYVFTDPKTGVEYLIYDGFYGGGICPRYEKYGKFCRGE